jgi:hypothetical protein
MLGSMVTDVVMLDAMVTAVAMVVELVVHEIVSLALRVSTFKWCFSSRESVEQSS